MGWVWEVIDSNPNSILSSEASGREEFYLGRGLPRRTSNGKRVRILLKLVFLLAHEESVMRFVR